jgi:hypothetical protein
MKCIREKKKQRKLNKECWRTRFLYLYKIDNWENFPGSEHILLSAQQWGQQVDQLIGQCSYPGKRWW